MTIVRENGYPDKNGTDHHPFLRCVIWELKMAVWNRKGRALNEVEVDYDVGLIMEWIGEQLD
jgi:hypothetical protein